ncbi:MAG: hypothetical protein WAM82_07725 [Thermoanaerobaculia bacterium]
MSFPDEKRPAADFEVLCGQLQRELHLLRQGEHDPEEPLLYEVYARQVRAECWRRVSAGNLAAPGELLARLEGVQSFVNAFLPEPGEPRAEAARQMHHLLIELALAARTLEPVRSKARLADRSRSAADREVLRVLFEHRDHYLLRNEVHKKMQHELSLVRVGQILVRLHHEGLLLRIHGTARGNPSAAYYALSEAGVEVCRELDQSSMPDELPLFSVDSQMMENLLLPDVVAPPSGGFARQSHQIATFYSYRGGLGRSLTVAHTGRRLAAKEPGERFLLIDMDLQAPGLNEYFEVPPKSAGLEGLVEGYFARPAGERRAWLARAVQEAPYVVPAARMNNLFLLPSGSPGAASGKSGVAARFQQEVARARRGPDGNPGLPEDGFLADLRHVLHQTYYRVLIDAPAGFSPTSYASTVLLPDELVLCLRPNPKTFDSVRSVLASFLWRDNDERQRSLVTFVFTPFPLEARERPDRWIEEHLLSRRRAAPGRRFRIVRLYQDRGIACGESGPGFLLHKGYEFLATLIGSAIDPDLLWTIEQEIARLASSEADRSQRPGAAHASTPSPARKPFVDLYAHSSGQSADEALAGLATVRGGS